MSSELRCEEVRELLAAFAVGALTGAEREAVVEHLAGCAECSAEADQLARVADGMLALAPSIDPPAGFVEAVLARLTSPAAAPLSTAGPSSGLPNAAPARWPGPAAGAPPRGPRSVRPARWRRAVVAAMIAVVAAAGGATVTLWQGSHAPFAAQRRHLTSSQLLDPTGHRVGTMFYYEGHPSWVYAALIEPPADGVYQFAVVDTAGRSHPVPSFRLAPDIPGYGFPLPPGVDVDDVAQVRMISPTGEVYTAAN